MTHPLFSSLSPERLHHGYLLEGDLDRLVEILSAELPRLLGPTGEIVLERETILSMDAARDLRERLGHKAGAERRGFILAFGAIGREAEQALLKSLEEPPVGVHIFLCVPRAALLLPTTRSRLVSLGRVTGEEVVRPFLALSLPERLKEAERMEKKSEDNAELSRETDELLAACERALGATPEDVQKNALPLVRIADMRRALTLRGTSAKQLLLETSLIVPKIV